MPTTGGDASLLQCGDVLPAWSHLLFVPRARVQAVIKWRSDGLFYIKNIGRKAIQVDNKVSERAPGL